MANAMYPNGAEAILNKEMDFSVDNFRCVLVDTGTYTYSAAHNDHADLTGIVATSGNMTSLDITGGVFDAADVTFSAVSGATAEAIVLYHWTGTSATSKLILYLDTGVTNLPVTPNGGDITIQWNASGIFDIV